MHATVVNPTFSVPLQQYLLSIPLLRPGPSLRRLPIFDPDDLNLYLSMNLLHSLHVPRAFTCYPLAVTMGYSLDVCPRLFCICSLMFEMAEGAHTSGQRLLHASLYPFAYAYPSNCCTMTPEQ